MNILFKTERTHVRRFDENDWHDFAEILTDKEVTYFEPYEPFEYNDCKKETAMLCQNSDFYAIVHENTGKVIGKIYFHNTENFDTWEIGYTFNKKFQGQGYATESIKQFMKYAFSNMKVRKIIANINGRNLKSQHLAERLAMTKEAHFRKDSSYYKDENGHEIFDDKLVYGILKEELQQ